MLASKDTIMRERKGRYVSVLENNKKQSECSRKEIVATTPTSENKEDSYLDRISKGGFLKVAQLLVLYLIFMITLSEH